MNLSIVTPTYNRAHLLPVLFKSLMWQTSKDFEWIVVDDGSKDNTEEIIASFKETADFPIIYVKKKNGGKHTALNTSHKYITTEIVLIADSDDWLVKNAVETIISDWQRYRDDKSICGISYLRGSDETHSLNNRQYRCAEEVSDFITVKVNAKNDCGSCEIIRTDVLKEFPFPEYKGERFIGESFLWFNAGFKYKTVYINKILYITEFFEDGLTKAGRKLRYDNPKGCMEVANLGTTKGIDIKFRLKQAILYNCYAIKAKMSIKETIIKSKSKFLAILTFLPGVIINLYWNYSLKK